MKKLKPCPFCNGKAAPWEEKEPRYFFQIACHNCGYSIDGEKEEIIKIWNTRYEPDAVYQHILTGTHYGGLTDGLDAVHVEYTTFKDGVKYEVLIKEINDD